MKELTFAEKLRMEQQTQKHDSTQANSAFVKEIIRAVKELASEANKKGKTYISGYIHISGGCDPGDWFPEISDNKIRMRWQETTNYYNVEDLNIKVRQEVKALGFTKDKVNITKENHIDYKTELNWLGAYKTKKVEGNGEDYFVWVDISW